MTNTSLPHENRSARRSARVSGWLSVLALLAAATLCAMALDQHVTLMSQAMIYVLAVVIASYKLGRLESVVCAVGSVSALNFFFVPPRWTLAVENRELFVALAAMLGVSLVISHLAAGVRRESQAARQSEQRARQLAPFGRRVRLRQQRAIRKVVQPNLQLEGQVVERSQHPPTGRLGDDSVLHRVALSVRRLIGDTDG